MNNIIYHPRKENALDAKFGKNNFKNHTTMKARKTIGALLIIAGITVALCTPDNCRNELIWRGVGIAAMFVGCVIGKYFDDGKENKPCQDDD